MSVLGLTLRQFRFENKSFWRNPASAFFTFVFPLMFLVIFNGLDLGPGSQFFVPSIAAFSVITACYTNIAISVSFLRDEGVLKRLRGTPLPAWAFLLARVLHATFLAIVLVTIVTTAGALFYNVDVPTDTFVAFAVAVIVGAASFSALGLAITSVIPNADAAPPIVNFSILPLLFVSDIFIPTDSAPEWLQTFAKIFPVKHYADAMSAAFNPQFFGGSGWETTDLFVVALWGIGGLVLASRFFSWEPRR
jgi:ABC-2 type transport system permease protein